jgi:ParB family chromosome partitioning protein
MINEAQATPKKKSALLPVRQLHAFKDHPYKVRDNEEMDALVESIREQGILSPLIVRSDENGEYEVISGHRRLHAAEKAGLTEVPALIYPFSREEDAIAVVDSNLHREHILPSEKAFAYKLKMEALSQQGKHALSQVATKTDTAAQIGKDTGESRDQVFRYIRLTHLIPELLQLVDQSKIALTPAVELSHLTEQEQRDLLDAMESEDCTPSLSQAQQLKKASQKKELTADVAFAIMSQPKANQQEKISFKVTELRPLFPENYTAEDIQKAIIGLIFQQAQKEKSRGRKRPDRDAR